MTALEMEPALGYKRKPAS